MARSLSTWRYSVKSKFFRQCSFCSGVLCTWKAWKMNRKVRFTHFAKLICRCSLGVKQHKIIEAECGKPNHSLPPQPFFGMSRNAPPKKHCVTSPQKNRLRRRQTKPWLLLYSSSRKWIVRDIFLHIYLTEVRMFMTIRRQFKRQLKTAERKCQVLLELKVNLRKNWEKRPLI